MISEADEASRNNKEIALANLREQVIGRESMGIIDMYERAAWNCGATVAETDAILREGRGAK